MSGLSTTHAPLIKIMKKDIYIFYHPQSGVRIFETIITIFSRAY